MAGQGLLAVGVPPQPLWLLYVKLAVLVISLIVLAIAAYALSLWPGGAGGMDIFVVRASPLSRDRTRLCPHSDLIWFRRPS
jgi:hypothetical protein